MESHGHHQKIWRSMVSAKKSSKKRFYVTSPGNLSVIYRKNNSYQTKFDHQKQNGSEKAPLESQKYLDTLKNNEKQFRTLAEMAPQIIWSSFARGEINYFNPFWYKFSGLTEDESLGNNWKNYVHPDDRDTLKKIWQSGIQLNKPFHLEFRLLNKNNAYEWFLCNAVPVKGQNQQAEGWIGTFSVIEEQKQILNLVKDKAEEFEVLADNITHHVWVENSNGDAEYMNKKFFDYTGLNQSDIYTPKRLEVFHPDDFEELKTSWYNKKATYSGFEHEVRIRRKDGIYRWFKIRAMPVKDKSGNVVKWIGTNTDIHDRKTLEKQKDDFLNVASHELKTPLTTIKGYVQMISALVEQNNTDRLKPFIDNASKSVEKLNRLIDDLLVISRIETGQTGYFEMEQIQIDMFLHEIVDRYALMHPERVFLLEGQDGVSIQANKYRLEQVFDNILSNAVKYSPAEKEISVLWKSINGKVQISILDHGDGISKENVDRVFDRFYRTDDNTLSGLGLGLFISREIIKMHRGEIWVESEVGEGSTFHVELPVYD
jgi:PAS domain S-box-containing protein